MQADRREPSLDVIWSLLQDQQRVIDNQQLRIEELEGQPDPAKREVYGGRGRLSRAGMLKAAAMGVAGVTGAGALLNESGGIARASLGEGQSSFSSAATPTVAITNTGTGKALSALGNGATVAEVDNSSTAANAVALYGVMTSGAAGSGSAGVRGYNSSTSAPAIGVYGNAPNGYGVYGTSTTRYGVYGGSNNNIGFFGLNFSGGAATPGVQGVSNPTSPAAFSSGIRGISNGTGTDGIGVYGSQAGGGWGVYGTTPSGTGVYGYSPNGLGVYGSSGSTADNAYAIEGVILSTAPGNSSAALRGLNNGTGGLGIGVFGSHAGTGWAGYFHSPGGIGAYGNTSTGTGVYGASTSGNGIFGTSTSGTGVYGETFSSSASVYAVEGISHSTAAAPNAAAIRGVSDSTTGNGIGVWGSQGGTGYGVYGTVSGTGYGVAGSAPVGGFALYAFGDSGATGTKSAIVRFEDGLHRRFYCMESPECWFEDFGSATLRNGRARVKLDPKFAQAVKTREYHVFLTPRGNSKGLYVSEQTSSGFVVREQEGGRAGVAFSYRVVALRKDVEAPRLQVTKAPALNAISSTVPGVRPPSAKQKAPSAGLRTTRSSAQDPTNNHESILFKLPRELKELQDRARQP